MLWGATNAVIAFPLVGSCVYDYIATLRSLEYPTKEYLEARRGCHQRSADKILYLSQRCGGIYFKAGQYIGTLDKIVPKEFTEKLRQLQDKAPQVPLDTIKITYEHDHKCSMANDFIWVEKKAIGAASLAQVHKVKDIRTGEIMALKIQYPHLRWQTKIDLFVIRRLTKMAN